MAPPSRWPDIKISPMMKVILGNLEIYLSLVGLSAIVASGISRHPATFSHWAFVAFAPTSEGLIHGLIFWLGRRRQRHIRDQANAEIKCMLRHLINNQPR